MVYLAHDLKTPLASIIGYLTLLEESPDLPVAARAKYTSITLDKAYRLADRIHFDNAYCRRDIGRRALAAGKERN